jgi:hypothetical protein
VSGAEFTTAAACCGCYLISRPCHHGASPNQRDVAKRNPATARWLSPRG